MTLLKTLIRSDSVAQKYDLGGMYLSIYKCHIGILYVCGASIHKEQCSGSSRIPIKRAPVQKLIDYAKLLYWIGYEDDSSGAYVDASGLLHEISKDIK